MDAGPLTALLNPRDEWHAWARDTMRRISAPLLTTEPVLTEASYLLRRAGSPGKGTVDRNIEHRTSNLEP